MKIIILGLLLLCATASFGQSKGIIDMKIKPMPDYLVVAPNKTFGKINIPLVATAEVKISPATMPCWVPPVQISMPIVISKEKGPQDNMPNPFGKF